MKIDKKYYKHIAVGLLLLVLVLFIAGGAKGSKQQWDYVPLPLDGVDGV